MAMFDWVKAGSGSPIMYGGATIAVQNPAVTNNWHVDTARDIIYVPASGGTPRYFDVLDDKFQIGPSGWNA